jgi:hypothetical protein
LRFNILIGPELARTLSAVLLLIGSKLAADETPVVDVSVIELRAFDRGWLVVVPPCQAEPAGARRRFAALDAAREYASYRALWLKLPVRELGVSP